MTITSNRMVFAGVLLGGTIGVLAAPPVPAAPYAPAEIKFVNDVHSHMQSYGDTQVERLSNAGLVGEGWSACHDLAIGVSPQSRGIVSVIAQYAKVDLCPDGCPQGCSHGW